MRKIILGLLATAAIAAPLALSAPANAGVAGNIDTTTYSDGTSYHHVLAADYTCGIADGHTVINFTVANGGVDVGSGVLTPAKNGRGVFAFSGTTGGYLWSYGGTYGTDGVWTDANATAGVGETYNFGTAGRTDAFFGSVVGSISGIPTDCPAPEVPNTLTETHGEYVSGAAHAGIKGKPLADIARNVALVGPYMG